jgi:hypothetical protein
MTFFSPIEPPDEPEEEDVSREWTGPPGPGKGLRVGAL